MLQCGQCKPYWTGFHGCVECRNVVSAAVGNTKGELLLFKFAGFSDMFPTMNESDSIGSVEAGVAPVWLLRCARSILLPLSG